MKGPGDIPLTNNPNEKSKPSMQVERLWTGEDSRHAYSFEVSASAADLFTVLNRIRESEANSTDQREIRDLLSGKQDQLNFGVYRFYYDAKNNKLHALINGGTSSPDLRKRYGPKLAAFLESPSP